MCCCVKNKCWGRKGLFLAVFFALAYITCFLWYFTLRDAGLKEMLINMHRLSFVWFNGMDLKSFFLGLIQSFIWGWIVAIVLWVTFKICGCKCCKDGDKCEIPKV